MSGAQYEQEDFILVPLTPIHVGGGEEAQLLPEDYRLKGDVLELVSARAVLATQESKTREQMIVALKRDPQTAICRLHDMAPEALVTERIKLDKVSSRELSRSGRRNQIDAFIRSGERPFLPGSSLKGALRTAWLAKCASSVGGRPLSGYKNLERWAFALASSPNETDTDPMRDVTIIDAPLPAGSTRIDPVLSWKKGKKGHYEFGSLGQMHRERMAAVVDGGAPPLIDVSIGLRAKAVRALRKELDPQDSRSPKYAPMAVDALLAALEAHHAPLWGREAEEKFFKGEAGARLRQALVLFDHLDRKGETPAAALVRLGWAAHAEAKSIDGFRQIGPQVKRKSADEGSSRHVVNLNGHPVPFGWALLVRKTRWRAPER